MCTIFEIDMAVFYHAHTYTYMKQLTQNAKTHTDSTKKLRKYTGGGGGLDAHLVPKFERSRRWTRENFEQNYEYFLRKLSETPTNFLKNVRNNCEEICENFEKIWNNINIIGKNFEKIARKLRNTGRKIFEECEKTKN